MVEKTWINGRDAIIWNMQLPRALLVISKHTNFTVVVASLEAVTWSPLADPHLLEISSGSAFGAILHYCILDYF